MKPRALHPSQQELQRRFDYNPSTGALVNRAGAGVGVKAGIEAGSIKKDGYRWVGVGDKVYAAHRLIWIFVHGEAPAGVIDHINGVRVDNRLDNLRDTTQSINLLNIHQPQGQSLTGMRGVTFHKGCGKYQATIAKDRKDIYLGLYATPEEAQAAYLAAKRGFLP